MAGGSGVALVTGASSGIGEATALALAIEGYRVGLTARRQDRLSGLSDRIEEATGRSDRALALPADITRRKDVERVVRTCSDALGPIDVLVNNAGVMSLSPLSHATVEEWERMVDVNVKGVLYALGAVLPRMVARSRGHIVNVSSLASRRPFSTGGVYSATKFAVRALSSALRLELSAETGIRVTDVEPGVVRTELLDGVEDPTARDTFLSFWSDHRALDPQDVADAVLYALKTPPHVNVNEILLRPTDQRT